MIKAVYAGSFDPVTNGHIDIITRAARLFGALTVLVMKNENKTPLFSIQERVEMLRRAVAQIPGVRVETAQGLLADYARKNGVQVLVRGLRGAADIEPEFCAAHFNKQFFPGAETVFLPTDPALQYISSTLVKEAALAGADIKDFVPPAVAAAVTKKLHQTMPR
ncbi:MAG: pantetheine-phosphate adenylyltransferase [Elusimicrobiaceae bacterium]|nr:pantetheine-phosphate adenylyltransferase [Elusimicrobiaceae bacterium]